MLCGLCGLYILRHMSAKLWKHNASVLSNSEGWRTGCILKLVWLCSTHLYQSLYRASREAQCLNNHSELGMIPQLVQLVT